MHEQTVAVRAHVYLLNMQTIFKGQSQTCAYLVPRYVQQGPKYSRGLVPTTDGEQSLSIGEIGKEDISWDLNKRGSKGGQGAWSLKW